MSKTAQEMLRELSDNVPKVYAAGVKTGLAQSSYDEAFDEGYSEGFNVGKSQGHEEGFIEGNEQGYEAGVKDGAEQGYSNGYSQGHEEGMKSESDRFWDNYLYNEEWGEPGYIEGSLFSGPGWTTETLRPTRDVYVCDADGLFKKNCMNVDLVQYFESLGKVLDFYDNMNAYETFTDSKFTRIGNFYAVWGWYRTFCGCQQLVTIDEFGTADGDIIGDQSTINGNYGDLFWQCYALENVTVKGILVASLNMRSSQKLSHDSIVSIVNALSDETTSTTLTLSKAAVRKAFETSEGANDGDESTEWRLLIAPKSNWTISLI